MSLCILVLSLWSYAQDPLFPGTTYDPNIPTMKQVVGFDFGHQIAMTHEAMAYAKALAAASDKVLFQEHGKSFEKRPLAKLFVSSKANLDRLQEFQQDYQAIADPTRTDQAALDELVGDLPVLVLLQESVHGNEISGTDSGLLLAHHLAAATNNREVEQVLQQAIVMIEITQNPDGRDRFITYSRQTRALGGDPDPQAAERSEPWASGRSNHYLFDMNRDWFAMTQIETKAKVKAFLEWYPQVSVDLHEMGSEASFFAANPAPPANPMLSKDMLKAYEDLGKAIAKRFDARGIDYFQGELFDSFYPGYGEAWPSLQGTIGVLFEQGSARGLVYQRRDGSLLHHHEAVANQAVASYAVVTQAAANREAYLRFFYQNRKDPITEYKTDNQIFLLPGKDPNRLLELGQLLQAQGIVVEQLEEPIKGLSGKHGMKGSVSKHQIPKGSLLVRFNQPAGKLARTLLIDQVDMDPKFIEEELARYSRREYSHIYDITAWSLPYDYGIEAIISSGWKGQGKKDLTLPHEVKNLDATLAYFIPYSAETGKIIAKLLKQGITPKYADKTIRFDGMSFPPGSLIIKRQGNPSDLPDRLRAIANAHQVDLVGTSNSWFDEGPSFGSGRISTIQPFKAAMLWDEPMRTLSAGWMRYTIEQEIGFPVTALKTANIGRYDLRKYKVLFIPSTSGGALAGTLGSRGAKKIKDWVAAGGVLVVVDQAVDWLINKDVQLLGTAKELKGGKLAGGDSPSGPPKKPEEKPEDMLLPQTEYPKRVNGSLLRAQFDTNHWLAFGMNTEQAVMVNSNRIYRPLRLNAGANVGLFAPSDQLLLSGFISQKSLDQIAHKPFAMVVNRGRGLVIAFTEDPNFRGFMKGLQPLMVNALFFAPSKTY